jgi:hypothetical protein
MTDRELLKLAAKAAGFHYHGHRIGRDYENCYVSTTGDTDDWFVWSPLTDDGDALRLAIQLRLSIVFDDWSDGETVVITCGTNIQAENIVTTDPYDATRRAIVRAAAEIGKEMT